MIATTKAAVYLAIKHVFPDVPINAGLLRAAAHRRSARDLPLRALPAAGLGLRRRGELAHRGAVFTTLAPGHPRRPLRGARRHERQPHAGRLRPAEGAALHHVRVQRRRVRRQRSTDDGLTNGCSTIGISKTQPTEVLEQHYPILFERYALREGSGGAGKTRGGFGVDYQIRIRRGEALLSFLMDHGRFGPPGLFGGRDGAPERGDRDAPGRRLRLAALVEGRGHPRVAGDAHHRAHAGRRRLRRSAGSAIPRWSRATWRAATSRPRTPRATTAWS